MELTVENLFRKVAHYMITYYLPSSLFVVVSWASFLIPSDDIQVDGVSVSAARSNIYLPLSL